VKILDNYAKPIIPFNKYFFMLLYTRHISNITKYAHLSFDLSPLSYCMYMTQKHGMHYQHMLDIRKWSGIRVVEWICVEGEGRVCWMKQGHIMSYLPLQAEFSLSLRSLLYHLNAR